MDLIVNAYMRNPREHGLTYNELRGGFLPSVVPGALGIIGASEICGTHMKYSFS